MSRRFHSLEELTAAIGEVIGPGDWLSVDQPLVNGFAELTGDREWLHVDLARARQGVYGGTIAHGFLTLSLVPVLSMSVYALDVPGQLVNYGLERVRFPSHVPVGSRLRSRVIPLEVTEHEAGHRISLRHTVEIDGLSRPGCVADTVFLLLPAAANPVS